MATQTTVLPGTVPENAEAPRKKRRFSTKRLLVMTLALVLAVAGVGYTMLKPEGPPEPPPQGPVLKLESITLNLAEGHFLKLGLALQFEPADGGHGGGGEHDGSHALDITIAQLSNLKVTDLNSTAARTQAKDRLTKAIRHAYHDSVTDVYFTEFVMQ